MGRLRNITESAFEDLAASQGWRPIKRGWPDFICYDDKTGEAIAVEVKPRLPNGRLKLLKRAQVKCMTFLESHGIRCFVSDGVTMEVYSRARHGDEQLRLKIMLERRARATKPKNQGAGGAVP